jgi:hypothetical protein
MSVGTGRSSLLAAPALAAIPRSGSAPAVVVPRRHAATAARIRVCGRGSLPSSPPGRCAAPAAADRSFRARRSTSATPTETGRATTEPSTRYATEARRAVEAWPNDLLRESEGERRMPVRREDEGASAVVLSWGTVAAGRGSCGRLVTTLFLAPLLALFHGLPWKREAGVRGGWLGDHHCQSRRSGLIVQSPPPRTPRHRGKH